MTSSPSIPAQSLGHLNSPELDLVVVPDDLSAITVKHYYRAVDIDSTVGTDEPIVAFCGFVRTGGSKRAVKERDLVPTVGKLVVLPKTDDCPDCTRIYSALLQAKGGVS